MGLMGRRALAPGAGLWLPDSNGIHMMFMRFPIDAVFVAGRPRRRVAARAVGAPRAAGLARPRAAGPRRERRAGAAGRHDRRDRPRRSATWSLIEDRAAWPDSRRRARVAGIHPANANQVLPGPTSSAPLRLTAACTWRMPRRRGAPRPSRRARSGGVRTCSVACRSAERSTTTTRAPPSDRSGRRKPRADRGHPVRGTAWRRSPRGVATMRAIGRRARHRPRGRPRCRASQPCSRRTSRGDDPQLSRERGERAPGGP